MIPMYEHSRCVPLSIDQGIDVFGPKKNSRRSIRRDLHGSFACGGLGSRLKSRIVNHVECDPTIKPTSQAYHGHILVAIQTGQIWTDCLPRSWMSSLSVPVRTWLWAVGVVLLLSTNTNIVVVNALWLQDDNATEQGQIRPIDPTLGDDLRSCCCIHAKC